MYEQSILNKKILTEMSSGGRQLKNNVKIKNTWKFVHIQIYTVQFNKLENLTKITIHINFFLSGNPDWQKWTIPGRLCKLNYINIMNVYIVQKYNHSWVKSPLKLKNS